MIRSKSQRKGRAACRRSLLLLAVLSLVISLLSLPLYAKTVAVNSPAGRMVDDVKRGMRDFGRDVRDAVDPDHDGILPDGSIDNGIANDGNQSGTHDPNGTMTELPQTSGGALDEVRPDTPVTDGSRPSPDDNIGDTTDNQNGGMTENTSDSSNGSMTDKPATDHNNDNNANNDGTANGDNANGENTDGETEGGFRWTGLIVAIVIAIAVIVLICLLIPRKKHN